ncbi:hypothetical protein ED733_003942 [Metarhizium rileyi]|uniref:WW domain-containing protein n=1 Tax=Metarhizium rileyi (strain RCEF 4871) TaxID=1649241 RepID=A0A5C6GFA0_METRR|nr:hypothetical protein ED733_003942 [Metarhizium rileyi]
MAGPTSPSNEGPSFGPPQLPPGWIAQWDGASKKYYYVQLATGVSQWEIPTQAAKTGTTPGQAVDHPYGTPPPELITHPDGSQTVKHPDGTMEPIMVDGTRAVDGPAGDRGLGTMAMNALLGGKKQSSGGSGISGLASQFLGGSSSGGGGHGGGSSGIAGKLAGQLASNLFSPSDKPAAPQNYHGGQSSNKPSHQGGIAGAVFGGVAHMFGGKDSSGGQNYGYSNTGAGSYAGGDAPTYRPPGSTRPPSSAPPPTSNTSSTPSQHHSQASHGQGQQSQGQTHGSQSYHPPPPPPQGHSPNQQPNYQTQAPPHDTYQGASFPGQQQHGQPPYGQSYPGNSSTSGGQFGDQHGRPGKYSGGHSSHVGQQQGVSYSQNYPAGNQPYQSHQQYPSGHY